MLSKEQKKRVLNALNSNDLYKHLKSAEEFHQLAMYWNWDGGVEPLVWLIKQSNCELATALLIYWKGAPGWYFQFENREEVNKYSLPMYDLLMEIESRVANDFYVYGNIGFDPTNSEGIDWTQRYLDTPQKRAIPAIMSQKINGSIVLREKLIEKSFADITNSNHLDELNKKILEGFRLLQERKVNVLPDTNPRDVVVGIEKYIDLMRSETDGRLDQDEKDSIACVGWVFAEQVRREYSWVWRLFIYGYEKEINLFSADNMYTISPNLVVVPLIIRSTWENKIVRFFDLIGSVKTTQEFRDFYAESMIFLMNWD